MTEVAVADQELLVEVARVALTTIEKDRACMKAVLRELRLVPLAMATSRDRLARLLNSWERMVVTRLSELDKEERHLRDLCAKMEIQL